jgi:thymidylate synthase (FAD)
MASLSVKSTRYTLKELKDEEVFSIDDKERAEKYLVMTGVEIVDEMSIRALENLRTVLVAGISNDRAKYCLPESYKTELTWTINARSLQNFISLRSDKAALWEIRDLANMVYETLPSDHRYLFENSLKETTHD